MPKLPSNLVKPPAFDNPLRRTGPVHIEPAETAPPEAPARQFADELATSDRAGGAVVIPIAAPRAEDRPDPSAVVMPNRITVRIDEATRRALESECYQRRIAGEKTNLAEIARGILSQWATRS